MLGDGKLTVKERDDESVSTAKEIDEIKYTPREGEERGSGGEGIGGRGAAMTTKRGNPRGGDAMVGVRESKGESSWKVASAKVT